MRLITLFTLLLFVTTQVYAQTSKLETVVQKGHSAAVKAVAVSADGRFLATGSRDRSAKLWDLQTGIEIRSFVGHEHTVNAVAFSPDATLLLTSSADNTARVWEVKTGKLLFTTPKAEKYMTDVAFSSDGKYFIAAGYSDSAVVYQVSNYKAVKSFMVNGDQGSGYGVNMEFSPDGNWLAIGEDNKTVNVYHLPDWKLTYTFKPEEGWCGGCGTLVAFSRDSKYLIKLSHNDKARTFSLITGKEVKSYGAEVDDMAGVGFSPDGNKIFTASDGVLREWESTSGKLIDSVNVDSAGGGITEAIYNNDGSLIITSRDQNIAQAWSGNGKQVMTYTGLINHEDKGGINYNPDNYWESYIARYIRWRNPLLLTPDNKQMVTGKSGTKVIFWELASGQPKQVLSKHEKAVICFDISVDGKYLLTGDGSGTASLWDWATGELIRTYKGHREPLFEVRFSPDGKQVATCSWDATVIVWNMASGEKESVMDLDNNSAYCMSFSPDGLYLVTGRFNKELELREPDSRSIVRTFIGHNDVVSSIAFGPEKYKMLSASWDGTARIWDISTGMMLQKFKGHTGAIHAAIYSPDGKKIITAGDDRIIRIWDVNTAQVVKTLQGHQAEITSIRISKDGKMLVSYSLDGVIKCWDLDKGVEFYEHLHVGDSEWMVRTKEGYFDATPSAREAIHFVQDLQVYQPDQFFEEYYRPDLIPSLYKSRGAVNDTLTGMEKRLLQSPPPLVKIFISPKNNGTEAEVYMKMTDQGGGVNEVRLYHNGKQIPVDKDSLKLPAGKGLSSSYHQRCTMVAGTNTFSVVAVNRGRVESIPAEAEYYSEQAENAAVCHVFAIGINAYKNPALTLNYAKEDAEAFVELIKTRGEGLFQKVVVHALYDEHATKKSIMDTITAISQHISSHDVFIFYYAGHGSMVGNTFYFIPSDCIHLYDVNTLSVKGVSATEMQEKFKNIKALKQIIIMDACQSGGSVELLSERGALEEKAIAQLSRSAGIHVLASAGSEQNAKEIGILKHGLFTYVLLDALNGKADGSPHDGKVTVYELKSYLDDQVPELNKVYSGKLQFPYTFSIGQDFPIVLE